MMDIFFSRTSFENGIYFLEDLSIGNIQNDCLSMDHSLTQVVEACNVHKPLRIWYSHSPHEYCGLCWLLFELNRRLDELPEIFLVRLPDFIEKEGCMLTYKDWSEVSKTEIENCCCLAKPISKASFLHFSSEWKEMLKQNTPLRAVVNGHVQSVPEDFYDCFIESELANTQGEWNANSLIGNILGKYQLGISDDWIALRLDIMKKK